MQMPVMNFQNGALDRLGKQGNRRWLVLHAQPDLMVIRSGCGYFVEIPKNTETSAHVPLCSRLRPETQTDIDRPRPAVTLLELSIQRLIVSCDIKACSWGSLEPFSPNLQINCVSSKLWPASRVILVILVKHHLLLVK